MTDLQTNWQAGARAEFKLYELPERGANEDAAGVVWHVLRKGTLVGLLLKYRTFNGRRYSSSVRWDVSFNPTGEPYKAVWAGRRYLRRIDALGDLYGACTGNQERWITPASAPRPTLADIGFFGRD